MATALSLIHPAPAIALRRKTASFNRIAVTALAVLTLLSGLLYPATAEALSIDEQLSSVAKPASNQDDPDTGPLLALGVGDAISVQVYGKPELSITTYVSDDGTVAVPLAGAVPVKGLSPAGAGERIAQAYRDGKFLLDPQITVFLVQFRSQQVSVLGAVRAPGRFAVESRTTVLDVLAQAGGTTEDGADTVVVVRPDASGKLVRHSVDLRGLSQDGTALPTLTLRGGDSVFVPIADQFYIHGEVRTPNMYRLEPGMTVLQAISRGGGITPRGSQSRVEIERVDGDGSTSTRNVKLNEPVQVNDVIRVKERFF